MTPLSRFLALTAGLALLTGAAAGQDPEPAPAGKPGRVAQVDFPTLENSTIEKANALLSRLEDAEDSEAEAAAADGLVELGASLVPRLVRKLSDDVDDAGLTASLGPILDRLTGPEHADALVGMLRKSREQAQQRWLHRRLATFHDAELRKVFEKGLKAKDGEVAFQSALGLAGLGDLQAIDKVVAGVQDDWSSRSAHVASVLSPAADAGHGRKLLEIANKGKAAEQIACLRLVRHLGTKDNAALLSSWLDRDQAAVKREAINALRVLVDGDEPIEKLSVFQAIEMAKQWKARI